MERAEHREDPEEQRRHRHQHEAARQLTVAKRPAQSRKRRSLGRRRGAEPQRPDHEHERQPGERAEDHRSTRERGRGADHRTEQRAEDGGAHRAPDQLAAPLARRGREQPRERAGPGERAPESLHEPREEKRREAVREREADAREPHADEPDEHGAPRAHPCRGPAARKSADEGAGRIRSDERSGARLREVQVVREVGQQRRESRVQHRVDEHEHGDEKQQTAHRPRYQRSGRPRSLPITVL